MNLFRESNGKLSSKRVVGIVGILVTLGFVYLGKGSDTLILALIASFSSLIIATSFSKTINPNSLNPPK